MRKYRRGLVVSIEEDLVTATQTPIHCRLGDIYTVRYNTYMAICLYIICTPIHTYYYTHIRINIILYNIVRLNNVELALLL